MPSNKPLARRSWAHSTAPTSGTEITAGQTAPAPMAVVRAAAAKRAQGHRTRIAAEGKSALGTQPDGAATVSADERRAMVEQAAYFRAERRGFASGHELEDWVAAEQEVDQFLSASSPV